MENKETQLTVLIKQDTKNALKIKAAQNGQTIKSVINKLIEAYLNESKQ